MRRVAIATVLAAAGALALAGTGLGATKSVTVKDNVFSPKSVKVAKGDKVTWRWTGDNPHNVTVKSGPRSFKSPTKSSGNFSKTLTKAGLYRIVCTIHAPDMKMTVRVTS